MSTTAEHTSPATTDPRGKGLSAGSLGLMASVVLGVSSVAAVSALTATLGPRSSPRGRRVRRPDLRPVLTCLAFVAIATGVAYRGTAPPRPKGGAGEVSKAGRLGGSAYA